AVKSLEADEKHLPEVRWQSPSFQSLAQTHFAPGNAFQAIGDPSQVFADKDTDAQVKSNASEHEAFKPTADFQWLVGPSCQSQSGDASPGERHQEQRQDVDPLQVVIGKKQDQAGQSGQGHPG